MCSSDQLFENEVFDLKIWDQSQLRPACLPQFVHGGLSGGPGWIGGGGLSFAIR